MLRLKRQENDNFECDNARWYQIFYAHLEIFFYVNGLFVNLYAAVRRSVYREKYAKR